MKNRHSLIFLCFLCFSVTINTSCNTKNSPPKNIICFVDFSEGPNVNQRLAYYTGIVNNSIITNMTFNDKLTVLPVDKGTLTNGKEIIVASLKKQLDYIPDGTSPIDEDNVAKKNMDADKKKITEMFTAQVKDATSNRENLQNGTDIIGALSGVNKYYAVDQENIIIFLSDMMNWSEKLKMEEGSFNEEMIDSKIAELPKVDGNSTKVLVHTGDVTNISDKHFTTVNKFWKRYFMKNNFSLVDYSSAATSRLEELILTRN